MERQWLKVKNFAVIILRGISQVFLLNNVITGILFLAGAFYNSWLLGIVTIVGTLIGTITALLLKYDKDDISHGLYGYNSALACLAIIYFFELNIISAIAAFLGAILTTIVRKGMSILKIPPYTAPFVISTWIVMAIILKLHFIQLKTFQLPNINNIDIIHAISTGVGQVMFQENFIAGIVIFIGILVCSRITALYAVLGSSLGVVISLVSSLPLNMINIGLFGFNGVLCGIALSGKNLQYLLLAAASIVISVFITYGMMNLGVITLTSPFVISTYMILSVKNVVKQKTRGTP